MDPGHELGAAGGELVGGEDALGYHEEVLEAAAGGEVGGETAVVFE